MKPLIIVWLALTAAVLWWATPRQTGFATRWPQLPPAMTWPDFQTARAAAARPSFCVWHDFGKFWTS